MQKFVALIDADGGKLRKAFEQGLDTAHRLNVIEYDDIRTLDDYVKWNNDNLIQPWLENRYGTAVYQKFMKMYFLLDVSPVGTFQNPVVPHDVNQTLTPLSLLCSG